MRRGGHPTRRWWRCAGGWKTCRHARPSGWHLIHSCADLHGVSIATIYRALREQFRPRSLHRRDRGRPRKLPQQEMERFCEVIAAMKLRTTNLKNRHLSTGRAIELLVETGSRRRTAWSSADPAC